MPEPLTITQAVREAFAQAEDLEDTTKILVAARVILKNSGNTTDEVKLHNVSQVRSKLKEKLGDNFTPGLVREHIANLKANERPKTSKTKKRTVRKPTPSSQANGTPAKEALLPASFVVDTVQIARRLVRMCGGVAYAKEILDLVGEDKR